MHEVTRALVADFLVDGTGRCLLGVERPAAGNGTQTHDRFDTARAAAALEQATQALDGQDARKAGGFLDEAERYGNPSQQEQASALRKRCDQVETEQHARKILSFAKVGNCARAAERVAEVWQRRKGSDVPALLRKRTSGAIATCVTAAINTNLKLARDLLSSPDMELALGEEPHQQLTESVAQKGAQKLLSSMAETLNEGRWQAAVEQLAAMVASGQAGPAERDIVMAEVRKGISAEVRRLVEKAFDRYAKARDLEQIDGLIDLAKWTRSKPAAGQAALPKDVGELRDALNFWIQCSSISCRLTSPTKKWTYGKVSVSPLLEPQGKAVKTLAHGQALWTVAGNSQRVLISESDPGKLEGVPARVRVGSGWVSLRQLRGSDTSEWLPPGDALVGTRVWGPLRPPSREYELGEVVEIDGRNVRVRRISDGKEVTLGRLKIQFGTIAVGTKVLARCANPLKLEAAVIQGVLGSAAASAVKVACLDRSGKPTGPAQNVQLGSLRTQANWLPTRR